jgi:acyl-CoA synthetase (AMP-forming)/AMP-acid ligase II
VLDEASAATTTSVRFSYLGDLLEHQAKRAPDKPAVLAPGRAALSYSRLYQHIDAMGRTLRAMGIGRNDRLAVVMPNGPEMAVAILAAATSAACAPINPAYAAEEMERYFADLQPHALLTQAGIDSAARRVALARGVRILDLATALDAEAGLFTIVGDGRSAPSREPARPGDVALLLLTSGTTSRPKIVPLSHGNICASAYSSAAALALRETDRCLNVLPLFHGHGLIATVLASLAAGASVACTPGCDVDSFFAWLTAFRPTWYSAVPTMHQAILAQARRERPRAEHCRLRLIRSASAPLASRIFEQLERTFDTAVIEFYGMTETASAPIACNPLPPRRRKAGSVGIPVGLDVAIMDEGGVLLTGGQTGHVVVRGASVTSGYVDDRTATQAAFVGDWFKTGDQGYFDGDGYLFLVGRTREMINRGGEKIAPREVDEVLLEHPAVAEAVTFAIPHATLGEDVASAIVLRPHRQATPKEIRQFASGRLAEFKVPRQVLVLDELPKGPTGKVQRVGLAEKLGLATSPSGRPQTFVAPRTPVEKALAGLWAEILQVEHVSVHDDFFALGGDSLLATHLLARIYNLTRLKVEVSRFFDAPTVAEITHDLETFIRADQTRPSLDIVRAARDNGVPASVPQEQVWQLQHALPGLPLFNTLYALRLASSFDRAVLERCVNEIVQRHDILRTTFAEVEGRLSQIIAPHLIVPLEFDDVRKLSESKKETVGEQLIQAALLHSFDLAHGPLIRARLVRLAEGEHLFLLTMHQLIVDGWSLGVLVDELAALYGAFSAGRASPLAPLSIQYPDFACWQQNWQSHPEILAQLAYWQQQLRDPLPPMALATAHRRRIIDNFRTARRSLVLPPSLSEAVKDFSQREGGTLFMALVAALKALLHRCLGEEDLRVATNVANRSRPGTERLIGPLANTVILRTNLGGDPSPRELIRRVRATTLAAYAHQDLPFEALAETLERERALQPAELSRVMILLHNAALRPVASCGHGIAFEEADPSMLLPVVTATTFDVILMLRESANGLVGSCVYKPHLFGARTIDRLLRDFRAVPEHMVTQPERPISTIPALRNETLWTP